jgi:four helix bundle protein
MQDFRRLLVWRRAHAFVVDVHRATRGFARAGHRSHQSQIVRAAESIANNIVEGCGARTPKEFARFLDVSTKSTSEVEYQLLLSHDYRILRPHVYRRLSAEVVEIRRMLCGLRRAILRKAQEREASDRPPDNSRTDN